MALANCTSCGSLFNKTNTDTCPKCLKEMEEQFQLAKNYLRSNKNASAQEISDATEVPLDTIIKFIREGRLVSVQNPNLKYPCEKCGAPISKGNYCTTCKSDLTDSLKSLKQGLQSQNQPKGSGYHIRDNG